MPPNDLVWNSRISCSHQQWLRTSFPKTNLCSASGVGMLTLPANVRIFVCKDPINIHKSFEGLGAIVQQLFPGELFSGALFVFLNRERSHMKVLFWDRDGFAIWYKRLQRGSFVLNSQSNILDRREFLMFLEGIEPRKIRSKFSFENWVFLSM